MSIVVTLSVTDPTFCAERNDSFQVVFEIAKCYNFGTASTLLTVFEQFFVLVATYVFSDDHHHTTTAELGYE